MSGPSYKRLTPATADDDRDIRPLSKTTSLPLALPTSGLRARSNSPSKRRQEILRHESFNDSNSSLLSADSTLLDPIPQHLLPPGSQTPRSSKPEASGSHDHDDAASTDSDETETGYNRSGGLTEQIRAMVDRNTGIILVLIAQFFASLMAVATRLLETAFDTRFHAFQILFTRMGITVILGSFYMWWKKVPDFPFGKKEVRWLLIARGLGGFWGVFGLYYSLAYLDLADATVITFLAPTVAGFACSIFLKEPFTRIEQIGGFIALIGVVLIARPTSLFSHSADDAVPVASGGDEGIILSNSTIGIIPDIIITPAQRLTAVMVALIGVLGAATAYTTIRWIGKRAHPLISVNYFATWCTIVSAISLLAIPSIGFQLPTSWMQWGLLLCIGIAGFAMQFLLTAGLQREKASRATNMVYSQMLFALIWERVVWDTIPAWTSLIGSALVLGSLIWVTVYKGSPEKTGRPRKSSVSSGAEDEERGLVEGRRSQDGLDSGDDDDLDEDEMRALETERGIEMHRLTHV